MEVKKSKGVRVYVRIRPTSLFAKDLIQIQGDKTVLIKHGNLSQITLTTSGVFFNSPQEDVYGTVVEEMVRDVVEGYNGCIICYGEPQSGKNFTLLGSKSRFLHRGIIPRTIQQIFSDFDYMVSDYMAVIRITALAIFKDTVYDLLLPKADYSKPSQAIREIKSQDFYKYLSSHTVVSEEDALCLMYLAEANRASLLREWPKRWDCSRGTWCHTVFNISVEIRSSAHSTGQVMKGKMSFVTLAGLSDPMNEAMTRDQLSARQSVALLEHSLLGVVYRKGGMRGPTCRRCKLSHSLRDFLEGNGNLAVILHLQAEASHMKATIQGALFAQRISGWIMNPQPGTEMDMSAMIKKLQRDVNSLQKEVTRTDLACNRKPATFKPMNEVEMKRLYLEINDYLNNTRQTINVETPQQTQAAFNTFRNFSRHAAILSSQSAGQSEEIAIIPATTKPQMGSPPAKGTESRMSTMTITGQGGQAKGGDVDQKTIGVKVAESKISATGQVQGAAKGVGGELDPKGFSIGRANSTLKTSLTRVTPSIQKIRAESDFLWSEESLAKDYSKPPSDLESREGETPETPESSSKPLTEDLVTRTALFEEFKKRNGRELYANLMEHKTTIAERKKDYNNQIRELQSYRSELDKLRDLYMEISQRSHDPVVAEEMNEILDRVDVINSNFRILGIKVKRLMERVKTAEDAGNVVRKDLIQEFNVWVEKKMAANKFQQMLKSVEYQTAGPMQTVKKSHKPRVFQEFQMDMDDHELAFQNAQTRVQLWNIHMVAKRFNLNQKRRLFAANSYDFLERMHTN